MVCPQCRTPNPEGTDVCTRCSTPIDLENATLPLADTGPDGDTTAPLEGESTAWANPAATVADGGLYHSLKPGSLLAERYEIVKLLGEGGMGAVYRAHDRELDRAVALKVIRPELARNTQVLQRFKQELILARQVTHRNVIRIFDLGSAQGARFITMEFIEGRDLSAILEERGKLPGPEAADIVAQVFRGLEAAHAEGVVHRDLKPQNIMMDAAGKASVMDFGIARSMDNSRMTRTGALLGTPTYMSPEQAQGQKVDARSDLYTMGIILYELLTGKPPFDSDNPMAALLRRIQEKPVPPIGVEPSVPAMLNDIAMKLLATQPADRYQSATEVLHDLDAYEAARTGRFAVSKAPLPAARKESLPLKLLAAALALMLGFVGWLYLGQKSVTKGGAQPAKTVSLLVADFQNDTGDAVFDGSLEPTVGLALEGASFVSAYSRGDARKVVKQIKPEAAGTLDENVAMLVAKREGIDYVVGGKISPNGSGYRINLVAVDSGSGKSVARKETRAGGKQEVLPAVSKLAGPIRTALGDKTPERASETYSSSSLEAAQAYAKGQELQWSGKYEEAIGWYRKAIGFDPNMGRAYAGLAVANSNLDRRQEAEKYYQEAMAKIDRMSERERYRTYGGYYLSMRNDVKAIEQFSQLIKQFPADDAGRTNLALAYFYSHNIPRAIEESRAAVKVNSKNVLYRTNLALYEMYAGQFAEAIQEATGILALDAKAPKAYVAMALSQFALGQTAGAAATYGKLRAVSARGASLAAIGLADLALYSGRDSEAVGILEPAIAADLAPEGNQSAGAVKLAALAAARRNRAQQVEAATRALAVLSKKTGGAAFAAARVLLEQGQDARALAVAAEMTARLEPEPQAYGKLLEGESLLAKGKPRDAIRLFQEAQKLSDTWLGHLELGRAYLEAGFFTEASSELDACLKRKGEATAVFFDDVPSFRYFPQLYYYQARAQEGLKSPGAAEAYRTFLTIKANSEPGDAMVADARKRAKALGAM